VTRFVLPIRRLLEEPALDPLVALAVGRLMMTDYYTLGRYLRSLDASHLQRLRDLRRGAVMLGQEEELRTYGTLVKVLSLAEGIFVDDEPQLQTLAHRLSEAVTVATLAQLDYATVDWPRLSIDPERPIPWELTESGKRHVNVQSRPR
jgi:hypothetical protein